MGGVSWSEMVVHKTEDFILDPQKPAETPAEGSSASCHLCSDVFGPGLTLTYNQDWGQLNPCISWTSIKDSPQVQMVPQQELEKDQIT